MLPSLKATQRLSLGFGAIAIALVLLGAAVWATAGWQARHLTELETLGNDGLRQLSALIDAARTTETRAASAVLAVGSESQQVGTGSTDREATALVASAEALARQSAAIAGHEFATTGSFPAVRQAGDRLAASAQQLAALIQSGHESATPLADVVDLYETQFLPDAARLGAAMGEFEPEARLHLARKMQSARATQRWSLLALLGSVVLALVVVVAVGSATVRHVSGRLERLVGAARDIAAGDILTPQRVLSNDEFGEITEALNQLIDTLSEATVSKTHVESIVQHMADPLLVLDQDVCVQMANPALLELLGYKEHQIAGVSIARIFAHSGRSRGSAIKRDIERGMAGNVETQFRTAAGRAVPVAISCALIRVEGQLSGLVIVAKDITLQKEREKELIRARDEAERMVQLRDAFLANMSHEIRTPLTGILGSAQILAEAVQGEHRNLARIIEDAGTRLLDTINSVLEMARIEAGEVQPDMEVLDFDQEAEAVVEVLRPIANKKNLSLSVRHLSSEPVAAQLDRGCLNRILNNLIGNALKFTSEGAVCVEVGADEQHATITVRDTGIGISAEFLPQLFDDFKQESTGMRRSHEGTGLGLAITKKLVEMMGGTIAVQSVKGVGSAFTVRFDRAPIGAVASPPSSVPAGDGHHFVASLSADTPWEDDKQLDPEMLLSPPLPPEQRSSRDVLLIEDNQQNAYMARFMLEGYETDVANTPDEALEFVNRYQYKVLLVDINLGTSVTGVDLLRAVRKIKGHERTPAVAVTAYALPGDRDRFMKEGFDDYVAKPYRREALVAAIDAASAKAAAPQVEPSLDGVLQTFKQAVDAVTGEAPASSRTPAAAVPEEHPVSPPAPAESYPYPVASPDDFLPSTFQPPSAASTPASGPGDARLASSAAIGHPPGRSGDGARGPAGPARR